MRAIVIDREIACPRIPRIPRTSRTPRTPRNVSRDSLRFPRIESHVRESLEAAFPKEREIKQTF